MTTRNLYALLVGINEYHKDSIAVSNLSGCVNDVEAIKTYLTDRIPEQNLHIQMLTNEGATYQAIEQGFKNHLAQAKENDTVLFYFAGHGSQEDAPEEFWDIEPDRLNETLVCHDSRTKQGKDLADKEIAYLVSKLADRNLHIVLIFDCCHSGSISRDLSERQVPKAPRQRPISDYLFSLEALPQVSATRSTRQSESGWVFPRGRHVVLSACRSYETAKEFKTETGKRRGIFSYLLAETLAQINGSISYRNLFQRINALVRGRVETQSPQIEAIIPDDLDLPFLRTGAILKRESYFTVSYHQQKGWMMNAGEIHGIPKPENGEKTVLRLFDFKTTSDRFQEAAAIVGEAEVIEVFPQDSKLKLNSPGRIPDPNTTYKAVMISQPLPPMGVVLAGDTAGLNLISKALSGIDQGSDQGSASLYVAEVATPDAARLRVLAYQDTYVITRPTDDRPLTALVSGYNQVSAAEVINHLEHIARWTKIAELNRPANSRISADALQVKVFGVAADQTLTELKEPAMRLAYQYDPETKKWKQPIFKVTLKNTGSEPLYFAVLVLTENFAVEAWKHYQHTVERIEPEQEIALVNDQGQAFIYGSVPKSLWQNGITEYKDILKVIACTTDFDATLLEQGGLGYPPPPVMPATHGHGTLNHLMKGVATRSVSGRPEDEETHDDWITHEVSLTFVRPLEATEIRRDSSAALGAGATLQPHPALQAKARLTTIPHVTRDLEGHILPPVLRADPRTSQLVQFTSSRAGDPGLSALELTDIDAATLDSVTPEQPLTLLLENQFLEAGEQLLAIGYDGEFYLPLGLGRNQQNGLEINLERLPEPVQAGERSLGGAIRIFFQKIISEKLNQDFAYPLLAVTDVHANGTVSYEADPEIVKSRVAQAKRIVLVIHGIIGDTHSILRSFAHTVHKDQLQALNDTYDLILSFDYENIHTSIEANARLLKQRLAAVGLDANHDKNLQIVAHSMGGLVSRWFIEREGGKDVVQRLIMLGTPNAGSPWSNLQTWAIVTLTLGLNGLSTMALPAQILGGLLSAIEAVDVTLDQMQPKSDFLQSLAASPDPGVPYTILAGNTSIIPAAITSGQLNRLLRKLRRAIEFPFLGQPNDIAVSVESIGSIESRRSPQSYIQEVACDHLTYFSSEAGVNALLAQLFA